MQIAEALQVSHILHNWNVHLLHTAEASEESWIGVGIFPACTRTEDENASKSRGYGWMYCRKPRTEALPGKFLRCCSTESALAQRVVGWISLATPTACSPRLS